MFVLPSGLTSGSDVISLVWMRIFPILTSLHKDSRAGSMVSPALSIDTPHSYKEAWQQFVQQIKVFPHSGAQAEA